MCVCNSSLSQEQSRGLACLCHVALAGGKMIPSLLEIHVQVITTGARFWPAFVRRQLAGAT